MGFLEVTTPRPHVALIRLNRPERMNAMSFDVMVPFREAMEAVGRDNDIRVCVITGTDRGFCSGADLEDSGSPPNISGLTVSGIAVRAMEYLSDLVLAMRAMPQPVIAAINGAAVGGGMCLSLGADIRIAGESAYFRAAGINNGLTATELGVSFLLPRAIGSSRAFEILLSGRDVDATEAERIGLVSRTVPDAELLPACYELADRIIGYSRVGVQLTKEVVWAGLETSSLEAAIHHESRTQLYMRLTTKNFEEAIRARKEKRPPIFRDDDGHERTFMPHPESEVREAYENFIRVGDSGDWSAWADLHTVDGTWVEHSLGTFIGREAIRTTIIDVMASVPPSMYFPVEFALFDGDRVVYYPWQCLPDPTGGDEVHRFGCVTILTYGGDGQFSYQEDIYNPAEGNDVFRRWIGAGGVMPGRTARG